MFGLVLVGASLLCDGFIGTQTDITKKKGGKINTTKIMLVNNFVGMLVTLCKTSRVYRFRLDHH